MTRVTSVRCGHTSQWSQCEPGLLSVQWSASVTKLKLRHWQMVQVSDDTSVMCPLSLVTVTVTAQVRVYTCATVTTATLV